MKKNIIYIEILSSYGGFVKGFYRYFVKLNYIKAIFQGFFLFGYGAV